MEIKLEKQRTIKPWRIDKGSKINGINPSFKKAKVSGVNPSYKTAKVSGINPSFKVAKPTSNVRKTATRNKGNN